MWFHIRQLLQPFNSAESTLGDPGSKDQVLSRMNRANTILALERLQRELWRKATWRTQHPLQGLSSTEPSLLASEQ